MTAFQQTMMVANRPKPAFVPHVGRCTPQAVIKWAPSLALWGGAGAGAVMLFMSNVPLFKNDILLKIPVVKSYFEDKRHPADNAF